MEGERERHGERVIEREGGLAREGGRQGCREGGREGEKYRDREREREKERESEAVSSDARKTPSGLPRA